MLIATDGIEMAAVAGVTEDEAHDECQHDHDDDGIGDSKGLAAADGKEKEVVGTELVEEFVVGNGESNTAANAQHAQGHDEGRKLPIGDEVAIDGTHNNACYQSGEGGQPKRVAGVHEQAEHDTSNCKGGAHRKIDAAGDHHSHLAQSHYCNECKIAGV